LKWEHGVRRDAVTAFIKTHETLGFRGVSKQFFDVFGA